jgi:hypothetical protein
MIKSEMVGGQPFRIVATLIEDDDSPSDLTGYTALSQLRECATDGTLIDEWSDTDPELVLSTGTVTLEIPSETTDTYDFSLAYIDIQLFPPPGRDGARIETVQIIPDWGVTRRPAV